MFSLIHNFAVFVLFALQGGMEAMPIAIAHPAPVSTSYSYSSSTSLNGNGDGITCSSGSYNGSTKCYSINGQTGEMVELKLNSLGADESNEDIEAEQTEDEIEGVEDEVNPDDPPSQVEENSDEESDTGDVQFEIYPNPSDAEIAEI